MITYRCVISGVLGVFALIGAGLCRPSVRAVASQSLNAYLWGAQPADVIVLDTGGKKSELQFFDTPPGVPVRNDSQQAQRTYSSLPHAASAMQHAHTKHRSVSKESIGKQFAQTNHSSQSSASKALFYNDPRYRGQLLEGCGEVCDTSKVGVPGVLFNYVQKHIDCEAIMLNKKADAAAPQARIQWREVPSILKKDFTMHGLAPKSACLYCPVPAIKGKLEFGYGRSFSGTTRRLMKIPERRLAPAITKKKYGVWTHELIENEIRLAKDRVNPGTYGRGTTNKVWAALKLHENEIRGGHFFVLGSERPWLEAQLLAIGARHVTTIEYGNIVNKHPHITIRKPWDINAEFLNSGGASPKFDGGATFSSVEHAGYNRYGDALNPWGDLVTMAKAWCITKKNGPMFVGVPSGRDATRFSANREYGRFRWPHLMANWIQSEEQIIKYIPWNGAQNMLAFRRSDGL